MYSLYDNNGNRKYLTIDERAVFLTHAAHCSAEVYAFCRVLALTGARLSEGLALKPKDFDFGEYTISIKCLKKRHHVIYRHVPIPDTLLTQLDTTFALRKAHQSPHALNTPLWPWCRTTAWSHVKWVMADADISGTHACPKGLRHSFAVSCILSGVPLNVVQQWLGHADLSTTAIYANVIGKEERTFAKRLWTSFN